MPKPILISNFPIVPPVTGVAGRAGPVANLYDTSGFFRTRSGSVKRARVEPGSQDEHLDQVFNLNKDFPPLTYPIPPKLDVDAVRALLVLSLIHI